MNRDELEQQLRKLIVKCPGGRQDTCPFRESRCDEEVRQAMALVDTYAAATGWGTELWTATEIAEYVGLKGGRSDAGRAWASRNNVPRVADQPHPDSGRPQALYPANHVRAAVYRKERR